MISSSHRFVGLPRCRLARNLGSAVGSHSKDVVVHLIVFSVATLRAHRHFRRFCSVTQSSKLSDAI